MSFHSGYGCRPTRYYIYVNIDYKVLKYTLSSIRKLTPVSNNTGSNPLKLKNPKFNRSEIEDILDILIKNIETALKEGKKIEIRGFGTFFIKKIKENYSARNPKTGEIIYSPEKNKVRFKPSKKLKKLINE